MKGRTYYVDYEDFRLYGVGHLILVLSKLGVIGLYTVDVVWPTAPHTADYDLPLCMRVIFED